MDSARSQDSSPVRIPVVGIVGGIGSGKSTVTRWVADRANIAVVDADSFGHQALRMASVKSALERRFGRSIFGADGEVQRQNLASFVFGESDQAKAARNDLEQIVHPAIETQIAAAIGQAMSEHREAVLLDAAVLLEAGWQPFCDAVVFIDAPDDVRHRRVSLRNGWSLAELRRREASQLGLVEKKQRSDLTISNASDDSQAGQQLLDFLCRKWGIGCKPLANPSQQS